VGKPKWSVRESRLLPTTLWVISIGGNFLLDGLQPEASTPLQPPDSSMCHFLCHLSQPCGPSPICYDHMFEGGPSDPEGMAYNCVFGYFCLLIMDTFWNGLVGGFIRIILFSI